MYTRGADGRLSFRKVTPHTSDVERLVVAVAEACETWLASQGYGDDDEVDAEDDDAQAVLQQASLLGMAALGPRAGKAARRVQIFSGREVKLPPRCAGYEGDNPVWRTSTRAWAWRRPTAWGGSGCAATSSGRPFRRTASSGARTATSW